MSGSDDSCLTSDDENEISEGIIGRIFNKKYFCLKYLGRGTFSRVWMVSDLESNVFYSMKIIFSKYREDAEHEILLMNDLTNSNHVVNMIDNFEIGDEIYIINELMGLTLIDIFYDIEDTDIIKKITKDIFSGIKELHDKNIVHNDIKLENIITNVFTLQVKDMMTWFSNTYKKYSFENSNIEELLKKELDDYIIYLNESSSDEIDYYMWDIYNISCKIIDLGNSEYIKDAVEEHVQIRQYRPPENIICKTYNDKSDIWSLGCIITELFIKDYLFYVDKKCSELYKDRAYLWIISTILGKIPKRLYDNNLYSDLYFDDNENIIGLENIEYTSLKDVILSIVKVDDDFIDLVSNMIVILPEKRMNISECLNHKWLN